MMAATSDVKTSLKLPRDVWKAAKAQAVEESVDLQDIVVRALKAYLPRALTITVTSWSEDRVNKAARKEP